MAKNKKVTKINKVNKILKENKKAIITGTTLIGGFAGILLSQEMAFAIADLLHNVEEIIRVFHS